MSEPRFSDTIVYRSELVTIGAFRCDREFPAFQDTGPIKSDCFVFPRTAVQIEHEDAPPFVASPNIVTFYNRDERYLRHGISARGDYCDWFGIRRDVASAANPHSEDAPFRRHRGRCGARTYLAQRNLFQAVAAGDITDPVVIDETVLRLLDRVVGAPDSGPPTPRHRALVHEVECLLAARFDQAVTLPEIATHAGASVYHLCRTFRAVTGFALHQYLTQLRIRHGLETVCENRTPFSRIAVDLGFAHHSHFTYAFRREFGVTPSQLRDAGSRC